MMMIDDDWFYNALIPDLSLANITPTAAYFLAVGVP